MAPMNESWGHISPERIKKVRKTRDEVEEGLSENMVAGKVISAADREESFANYPKGEGLMKDARRAEIRKRVSKRMFEADADLSPKEKADVIERQINRYFNFAVHNKTLRGHVEAPHGIAPSDETVAWCKENNVVSFEEGTRAITEQISNYAILNRPRIFVDINNLPKGVESSLRSDGAVFTEEDNLNAVKAQRDVIRKILEASDNIDSEGKAINPHLAIFLHGKT